MSQEDQVMENPPQQQKPQDIVFPTIKFRIRS